MHPGTFDPSNLGGRGADRKRSSGEYVIIRVTSSAAPPWWAPFANNIAFGFLTARLPRSSPSSWCAVWGDPPSGLTLPGTLQARVAFEFRISHLLRNAPQDLLAIELREGGVPTEKEVGHDFRPLSKCVCILCHFVPPWPKHGVPRPKEKHMFPTPKSIPRPKKIWPLA